VIPIRKAARVAIKSTGLLLTVSDHPRRMIRLSRISLAADWPAKIAIPASARIATDLIANLIATQRRSTDFHKIRRGAILRAHPPSPRVFDVSCEKRSRAAL
jgi:hypothetical protein